MDQKIVHKYRRALGCGMQSNTAAYLSQDWRHPDDNRSRSKPGKKKKITREQKAMCANYDPAWPEFTYGYGCEDIMVCEEYLKWYAAGETLRCVGSCWAPEHSCKFK